MNKLINQDVKKIIMVVLTGLLFFESTLGRYIEFTKYSNYLVAAMIFVLTIFEIKKSSIKLSYKKYIDFIICIFIIFINIICSENNNYLSMNIKAILFPMLFVYSTLYIFNNTKFFKNILRNDFVFKLLNIFWIVNLIVLYLQLKGTGIFIKNSWLEKNSFYLDHCSGLFGFSGTHQLTFFSIFILFYNIEYIRNSKLKNKLYIYIYIVITEIIIMMFSTQNDNTFFMLLLPIMTGYYFLFKLISDKKKVSKKIIWVIIFFLLIVFMFVFLSSYIEKFLEPVIYKLNITIESMNNKNAYGGNERLAIFFNALQEHNGWKFGESFGGTYLNESGAFGFAHFGLSNIGSFTMLGGIWFYLMICYIYTNMLMKISNSKNVFLSILIFAMLILDSAYSDIFISSTSMFWITMFYLILGIDHTKYKEENVNE